MLGGPEHCKPNEPNKRDARNFATVSELDPAGIHLRDANHRHITEQILGGAGVPQHISQVLDRDRRPPDRVIIFIRRKAYTDVHRGHDNCIEDHPIVRQPKGIIREECLERSRICAKSSVILVQLLLRSPQREWPPVSLVLRS